MHKNASGKYGVDAQNRKPLQKKGSRGTAPFKDYLKGMSPLWGKKKEKVFTNILLLTLSLSSSSTLSPGLPPNTYSSYTIFQK